MELYFSLVTKIRFFKSECSVIECPDLATAVKRQLAQYPNGADYIDITTGIFSKPPTPLYADIKEIIGGIFGLNSIGGNVEFVAEEELASLLEELILKGEVVLKKTTWGRKGWKSLFTMRTETLGYLPREELHKDAYGSRERSEHTTLYQFYLGNVQQGR